ncbi:hypothetical protein Mapa_017116, partial [Marchantia paleacea]
MVSHLISCSVCLVSSPPPAAPRLSSFPHDNRHGTRKDSKSDLLASSSASRNNMQQRYLLPLLMPSQKGHTTPLQSLSTTSSSPLCPDNDSL